MRWHVRRWLNLPEGQRPALEDFRGRVLVVHAFQMLCPGCVLKGLPQAKRIRATFHEDDVAVVGLHSVFEHHEAMGDASLAAFLSEFAIDFPIAVDEHTPGEAIPRTMRAWGLRGTPSTVVFDPEGRVVRRTFGIEEDLVVGATLAGLVQEGRSAPMTLAACTPAGCSIGA